MSVLTDSTECQQRISQYQLIFQHQYLYFIYFNYKVNYLFDENR